MLLGFVRSGDFPEWSVDDVNDVPQKRSGCDGGVFTCMFALLLSVDQTICFYQKFINGQECRNWIGLSILREGLRKQIEGI